MNKILSGVIILPLLLVGCGKEEIPPVNEVVSQPPIENQSLHFDLKEENNNGFQVDIQEPEGLTEEITSQFPSSEGQVTAEIGTPPVAEEVPVVTEPTEEELSLPSLDQQEESENTFNFPPSDVQFSEVPIEYTSNDIKTWVDERKLDQGGYVKEDGGKTFLLVTAGERSHTGFKLKVNGVYEKEDIIEFHFSLEEIESATLQIATTPTLLVSIPVTKKEIRFYGDL